MYLPGPLTSVSSDEALRSSEWTTSLIPSPLQAPSSELMTLQNWISHLKMISTYHLHNIRNFSGAVEKYAYSFMCFASDEKPDGTDSSSRLAFDNPKKLNSFYGHHLNDRTYVIDIGCRNGRKLSSEKKNNTRRKGMWYLYLLFHYLVGIWTYNHHFGKRYRCLH